MPRLGSTLSVLILMDPESFSPIFFTLYSRKQAISAFIMALPTGHLHSYEISVKFQFVILTSHLGQDTV